jgi:hypothetical protein
VQKARRVSVVELKFMCEMKIIFSVVQKENLVSGSLAAIRYTALRFYRS